MRLPVLRISPYLAAGVLLLAGCGGSGGGAGLPQSIPITGPTGSTAKSTVTFKIAVPKKTASARPAYVSPATQSMTIAVTQGSTSVLSQTVGLTATSTGCTSSLSTVTCTLQLSIPAGSYTASVTTYDGTNGTGNVLSLASGVAFTVTSGQNNLVPLSLSGVPKSILVTPSSLTSFYVIAQDADGNFIVGSGAPTYTAAKVSGSTIVSITQPTATAPNTFAVALASPAPATGTETLGVTAGFPSGQTNACSQSGASCTASATVTANYGQTAFVSNYENSNVLGYSIPLTSSTQAASYTLSTANSPYPITVGPTGNLFVPGYSNPSTFQEFAPPYTGATVTNTTGGGEYPYAVAAAPNGDVFVGYGSTPSVGFYAPPYTSAPTMIGSHEASAVATDANNNLYVANTNGTLSVYAPPYTGAPVTVNTTGNGSSMAVSGSKLFIGENSGIDVFTLPVGSSSTPAATLTDGTSPGYNGVAVDPSGNLWAAGEGGGASTDGVIEEFTTPFSSAESPAVTLSEPFGGSSTGVYPYGIAVDAGGNVYVVNEEGGQYEGGFIELNAPVTSSSTPAFVSEGSQWYYPYYIGLTPPALVVTP